MGTGKEERMPGMSGKSESLPFAPQWTQKHNCIIAGL